MHSTPIKTNKIKTILDTFMTLNKIQFMELGHLKIVILENKKAHFESRSLIVMLKANISLIYNFTIKCSYQFHIFRDIFSQIPFSIWV